MSKVKTLPVRAKVKTADTWDLSSLFASDAAWEKSLKRFESQIDGYQAFRGKLGDSATSLANCLKFDSKLDRAGEKLGIYAFLKTTEDQANGTYQGMIGRFSSIATRASEAGSYIRPEIMAISAKTMKTFLVARPLRPYRLLLERLLRQKPHTLSTKEERLLAMQGDMAQAASKAFRQLLDTDMKFDVIRNENGERVELTTANFSEFLISPKRSVRRAAFEKYYTQFTAHENTLAATLEGSIQKDIYYARARGYDSALEAALFPDKVPQSVYDNLIASVHKNLPAVHHYYDVRRRKMKLKDIHHYDTYVPILSDMKTRHTWQQAVKTVIKSLEPLGGEYTSVLEAGLKGRWCDRYPNQGKQSGAFSCGSYDADPFIMMNFMPEVLNDVFTLAHEAGHSMHSHYSAGHQTFEYYNYTIFVAEVASTFNEQLLSKHLLDNARDDKHRAYLLNREIDGIRGTIIRQTMFAEFEKITHAMAEAGEALTLQAFQEVYRDLLCTYFGPQFTLDAVLALECLRIPHFYRAFYVYKYATGMSAAIALCHRVVNGGESELNDYLSFLKGGCSKYSLDLLRDAGVDMEQPEPVDTALRHFEQLVTELEQLI
ncbi:MAG: oligoendopeptidase F [Pirellulaceae bacterium]|nr:oligoendopeptidase F [Pirellulaceae bacterium]